MDLVGEFDVCVERDAVSVDGFCGQLLLFVDEAAVGFDDVALDSDVLGQGGLIGIDYHVAIAAVDDDAVAGAHGGCEVSQANDGWNA